MALELIFLDLLTQRITIPEILSDEWFKKGYKAPSFEHGEDVSLDDIDAVFDNSEVVTKMLSGMQKYYFS